MNNNILFNWHLLFECNYRCPYCFYYGTWHKWPNLKKDITVDDWIKGWRNIHKRYGSVNIEITGGEPFTYPFFNRLIKEVSKDHYISITTNLSCSLEYLIDSIEGAAVGRLGMNMSFHPTFAVFEDFVKKASLIKEKQISNKVLFVTYPPQFHLLDYYKDEFQKRGFCFLSVPFRGEYQGKRYPDSYTEEEIKKLNELCVNINTSENNALSQKRWVQNQIVHKKTKGKLCRAGQLYVHIDIYGGVHRCSIFRENEVLGNFFDKELKLFDAPQLCEREVCVCESKWLIEEEEFLIKSKH